MIKRSFLNRKEITKCLELQKGKNTGVSKNRVKLSTFCELLKSYFMFEAHIFYIINVQLPEHYVH